MKINEISYKIFGQIKLVFKNPRMSILYFFVLFINASWCLCQDSSLVINVVETNGRTDYTLVCNVASEANLTRWTHFKSRSIYTGKSFMSYENGTCTVSPSNSFLNENETSYEGYYRTVRNIYSYTCNSTYYQVTIHAYVYLDLNNRLFACRDAIQPDGPGNTWIIKIRGNSCLYCEPTMVFDIREITEGDNVTFICRVSSDVPYVNWNRNMGSNTTAMGVQNGQCTTQGSPFLNYTSEYIYSCNKTVYQVTRLNAKRSEHYDMYMCTPSGQNEGTGSNWIIKVKAPVTSVMITPADYLVNATENAVVQFTCTTSTARPAASVHWYRHPNGNSNNITQITENITSTTDYNDLSVITSTLHFVPQRQHNNTRIYCTANNSVNTNPVISNQKILLNVLYKAEDPYILQGSEYHVIENTTGTLSCTVKGGNPKPTLSWSCNNVSPINQSIINSNANVTTLFTWTSSRTHEGICTCKSQQSGFTNESINVKLIVLYPPSKPAFIVNGNSTDGDISFIEGKTRSIKCTANSKPSPDNYTWTGPRINESLDVQQLTLSNIRKIDAGEYRCSVHNTMNPSTGGYVAGENSSTVNIVVLYPPSQLYFVYGNQNGQNISNKVIDVIQGDTFQLICKSKDGLPIPTISWNGQRENMSVLRVENIQESTTNATCTASYNMKETNILQNVQGNISDTIRFTILVRPTISRCEFNYNVNLSNGIVLRNNDTDKLMVIENKSFTLECSVDGKPPPTVLWNIPQRSLVLSPSVTVNNLTREMKGDYVFTANSLLEPSFKVKQNVTVNKTISVQVLYPPAILPLNDIAKLKEEQLNTKCIYTAGIPENTSIKWTRNIDNREWNTTTLNIESLKKSDTGIYTCIASNLMKQTGDSTSYIGQHNQSFHLDVQSAAKITSFTIDGYSSQTVTVNESDPVRLICNADSNPTAVMTVRHESKTLVTVTSNSVEYNIAKASCSDEGFYFCSARNIHHESTNIIQLFVNCTDTLSSTPVSLIGGIVGGVGGVTGCIIIGIVITVIIRRYQLCKACDGKMPRDRSDKTKHSAEKQAYINAGRLEEITNDENDDTTYNEIESDISRNNSMVEDSAYYNVVGVSNYEMVNLNNVETTPYSSLDQTKHSTTTDTTNEDKKGMYENMEIKSV